MTKLEHAKHLAQCIIDSQSEWESLDELIRAGQNPSNHVLYHAYCILGNKKGYEEEVEHIAKHANNN